MDVFVADWLNLLIRWAHLIAGIGWIGTSFYFIALDVSLRRREKMNEGVFGTAWQVHGGGFYHVEKYQTAPKDLPPDLTWFKWEAYLTWVTGFGLLIVQYYWHAQAYLIDPSVADLAPWQAIAISVVSLLAGWAIYDGLCRSPIGKSVAVLGTIVFVLIVASSWGFSNVFSGRGALIHVGALVGTIMAANVFMIIIPNQRRITASLLKHETPDPRYGEIGKQRSVHNTYLTLPVLVLMVSNHYPMLTNHPHSWLMVALILVIGATVRHAFVRHEAGDEFRKFAWSAGLAVVGLIGALVLTAPRMVSDATAAAGVTDPEVLSIVSTHCAVCHSATPTHPAFEQAPKGMAFETVEDLRRFSTLIHQQAVMTDAMPLGNETGMTADERSRLGAWLAAQ